MNMSITDRKLKNTLKHFRYTDKKTGKSEMSGFPNDWTYNGVLENKPNPNYYDINFNYDFPISYKMNDYWMRQKIEDWVSINRNRTINYIIRNRYNEYQIHIVQIENVDWGAEKIRFIGYRED